ncbi:MULTISPECIES: VPA1269 family protein [Aeromonas]|uniref:Integrase family protein n=1 Tax=Aeromonas bestiarum TaxID=105751 RepID=A0ABT7Q3D9_9GAMM|nr:VPA1269 family protein [Aeromonas bestiarum]MDM5073852.1 integrase family protein [Aeromonas bestiarum]
MEKQEVSISDKLSALSWLFTAYIPNCAPYASSDILSFFSGRNWHISSADEMQRYLKENGVIDSNEITRRINICCDFIDSVILQSFSELDDYNNICPVVNNPLNKLRYSKQRNETVRIPLPYRYIQELRQIICPVPKSREPKQSGLQNDAHFPPYRQCHFRDWKWAQENTGNSVLINSATR